MSAEIPAWVLFLFTLGTFGPIAVPALLVASALLIGRLWKASEVNRAARRRARLSFLREAEEREEVRRIP